MLMTSCETTSTCTDCFTESTVNCLCAVPRQYYVNNQNVIGVVNVEIPQEEVCVLSLFIQYNNLIPLFITHF